MPKLRAFLFFLACSTTFAQSPVGSIAGTVKDPSGAVVAGAVVSSTSLADGGKRSVVANEQGYFLIPTLLPGEYKVVVEAKGFRSYEVQRVEVAVGQIARVDANLTVGTEAVTVEVAGGAVASVDTQQATVGGVVDTRQIAELPLNGRNYLELARLQPGVEINEGRAFDPTKARYTGVSIGGRSGRETRITIDGIDAVDEHVGTTTLNLTQESIQEFQVSTSSSDASTGLSATGGVNIITRRGSNTYHGSAFAYGRGSSMAARTSFAPTQPDFDREQWGGNIGGPVVKDKLFWFGSFEKSHESSAIGVATPYFPSITTWPAPYDERSSSVRVDYKLPHQSDFFFRWSRDDNNSLGGFGGNRLPSAGNFNNNVTHQFAVGVDSSFTSRLTNAFRFGFTDFKNRVLKPDAEAAAVLAPGTAGFGVITDDGLLISGPDNITPQSTFERFFQTRDDQTWSAGKHTLRYGGDVGYRRVQVYNYVSCAPQITAISPSSRSPADILNAGLVQFAVGNCKGIRIPGTSDDTHRNTRFSFYFAENWRLVSNLSLNLGLRYEVDTHPLNNDLPKPDLAAPLLPRGTAPTPIDKKNFAPQIGLAWDPFKNGKTSIRAGAGIFYALRVSNLITNERAQLAPFNSGNTTFTYLRGTNGAADFNKDGTTDFDFTPAIATTATVTSAMPIILAGQKVFIAAPVNPLPGLTILRTGRLDSNDLPTPYSMQYNAGVQRQLGWNSVLDVNVIYSRTTHEFMQDADIANFFPGNGAPRLQGDGTLPTNFIQLVTADGYSRYRALTAKWDKRFAKRFQYTASYALSRLNTTNSDGLGQGGGVLVNRNVAANYGPGQLDRTHRLTMNGIVELPKGVRVSLISTHSSGLPQSITVGSADINGDGINGDLLPGSKRGSLGRDIHSVDQLNALIRNYNQNYAGKLNPRNQRLPYLFEYGPGVTFNDSYISQDLQVSKVFAIKERLRIEGTAQVFNLFNISNLVGSAGLPSSPFNGTLTTIAAASDGSAPAGFKLGSDGGLLNAAGDRVLGGVNRASGFGSLSAVRPSIPTGTGLPRAFQFGMRFSF
ncbi:MAG TPA: carboxypeptidase regulatory-like domain-containing protein [Bryobacteraceae bacterium]|nr:carboxypeptidase regulatory-like domain-containing protein [Bryobacteraceae bacterium]